MRPICLLLTFGLLSSNALQLENDRVRVVVEDGGQGIPSRRFYAQGNGSWRLVLESFAPDYSQAAPQAVALWDMRPNARRYLVNSLPASIGQESPGGALTVRAEYLGAVIMERLTLNETGAHVEIRATLPGPPCKLDTLLSAYTFATNGVPSFVHTPGVKFDDPRAGAGRDQVTGDRSFHAPAVILQEGGLFAALVPDLISLNNLAVVSPDARRINKIPRNKFSVPVIPAHYTMPTLLDLNVRSGLTDQPVLTFGLGDTVIGHHIRYVRDERGEAMVRTMEKAEVGYAFDLFLAADAPAGAGFQSVARHQWSKFGHPVFSDKPHLAMPFEEYACLVTRVLHSPGPAAPPLAGYVDHGSWLEWEMNGLPVGGYRCAAGFWNDVIHNGVFWNGMRDATGMFHWGRELGDETLVARARRIVNFCLSAPRNPQGLFPTLYDATARKWGRSWTDPPHGQNRLFLRDSRSFEIPALCKTGAHLLDYHLRAESDPRIPEYLRPFGDWLLTMLDDRGRVPSFVTDTLEPSPILLDSAQPAAAMWFLAELFNATRDARYLEGAKHVAAYLERDVLPTARWIDLEQYLSCGAKPLTRLKDEWQGQWFRGNLCVIWAAEGFAALHRADGDARWLRGGGNCVDYLSFTQCVWQPRFIYTANPFGGFGVDNGDSAPMLDARQAEAVRPLLYFGKALGRQDLLERGVAAARSSCVLITHPRHTANGIFPHSQGFAEGLGPENIDHEAHPQCPMRTHPSWGEGSGVYTGLAEVRHALGGLYVDIPHRIALGADGVRVRAADFSKPMPELKIEGGLSSALLKLPWEKPFSLRIQGLPSDGLIRIHGNASPVALNGTGKIEIQPESAKEIEP